MSVDWIPLREYQTGFVKSIFKERWQPCLLDRHCLQEEVGLHFHVQNLSVLDQTILISFRIFELLL